MVRAVVDPSEELSVRAHTNGVDETEWSILLSPHC